jgi:hypothetical protein
MRPRSSSTARSPSGLAPAAASGAAPGEQLVADRQLIIPARRPPANGLEAWDEVLRGNYEGMVAKDPASAYTPGRTLSWLKVKQRDYRQEARGFHRG